MVQQEKIVGKWKSEHKKTVEYFEKQMKQTEVENRTLKDKVMYSLFKYYIHRNIPLRLVVRRPLNLVFSGIFLAV